MAKPKAVAIRRRAAMIVAYRSISVIALIADINIHHLLNINIF